MIVNFRPIKATAFPPNIPPNKAPTATKDWNKEKEQLAITEVIVSDHLTDCVIKGSQVRYVLYVPKLCQYGHILY